MPDEIEVPLEEVHEHLKELHEEHHDHHEEHPKDGEHHKPSGWMRYVAVLTAILAVVAAIGALQSGLLVNEALLAKNEQVNKLTQASDQWNYYQAEGLKSLIYSTTAQTLPAGSPAAKEDLSQAKHYKEKQADIQKEAKNLEAESTKSKDEAERFLEKHHVFAVSVSLCQIAIALSAVAALTRRRNIWLLGTSAGVIGAILLIYGFLAH